jgi:hypothetical protein
MKTTQADIKSLLTRVDSGELRLPEIQRAYVWKPAQIAGLIDSLYRQYPSGSLLLWETDAEVSERRAAIEGPNTKPLTKPQYILDGQQRLTSLHRVLTGHEKAEVVFNVQTEKFQIASAATKKDVRWVGVYDVLNGRINLYELTQQLEERIPDIDGKTIHDRLTRLGKALDYLYYVEIIEDLPYEQVTDIFVRVNSKGRPLGKVDLALATVSARWTGVIAKLEAEAEGWEQQGYGGASVSFLTRCLAASATDTATLKGFINTPVQRLEDGWKRVRRGLNHLVPLLQENARIETSDLLPSVNALVPAVTFLGSRPEEPLPADQARSLIYWLFGVFMTARYSGSADTVMAQDSLAARGADPLTSMYKSAGLLGERLVVAPEQLIGKGANSAYFLFSYLAAVENKATDWYFGTEISSRLKESQKLEYHHIHPRATLSKGYKRAEINDLANYAFISGKANRRISHRSPRNYFPEIGEEDLAKHYVPLAEALRDSDNYPDFLRERRVLLSEAMTAYLDKFRPESVGTEAHVVADPTSGEWLNIAIYAMDREDPHGVVVLSSRKNKTEWQAELELGEWTRFFGELEEGLGSDLTIGLREVSIQAGEDEIVIPTGPLDVVGSLDEWRKILDRELGDLQDPRTRPLVKPSKEWTDERVRFPVLQSD